MGEAVGVAEPPAVQLGDSDAVFPVGSAAEIRLSLQSGRPSVRLGDATTRRPV